MSIGKGKRLLLLTAQKRCQPSGSGVTAVSLVYGSDVQTRMLLSATVTYQLSAVDQNGNPLSNGSGTWASTDNTNCPINSSGLVSPSALTNATITFTHTASGKVGTVAVSVLGKATVLITDPMTYSVDSDLRSNIRSTVTTGTYVTPPPTGNASALYGDGINEGLVTVDTTRRWMNHNTLRMYFPGGNAAYGQLDTYLNVQGGSTNLTRFWFRVVKRYDSGFTPLGSGVGGAASYKDVTWGWSNSDGRGEMEYSNTTGMYLSSYVQNQNTGGPDQVSIGSETTEWSSQKELVDVYLYEQRTSTVSSVRMWRFYAGDHPITGALINSGVVAAPITAGVAGLCNAVSPTGHNYNQTRNVGQNLYKNVCDWEVSTDLDPYGLINDTSTPSVSGISGNTIAHGTSNATIILTGTNLNANCWADSFSNAGVTLVSATPNGGNTQLTVVVNVSAGASTGAGTFVVKNGTSGNSSASQTLTIT